MLSHPQEESLHIKVFKGLNKISKILRLFPDNSPILIGQAATIFGFSKTKTKLSCFKFIKKALSTKSVELYYTLGCLFHSYGKNSKQGAVETHEEIELMRNCLLELISTHALTGSNYIADLLPKLAYFIQKALKSQIKSKVIFNWQFLSFLQVITQAIIAHPKQMNINLSGFLKNLLGILHVPQNHKFTPFKLHLIKLIISLQYNYKCYIPGITSFILDIISDPNLCKRSKSNRIKDFCPELVIKASKEELTSDVYKEKIIEESTKLLLENIAYYGDDIAFPESSLPIRLALKKIAKDMKNSNIKQKLAQIAKYLEENSIFIDKKRIELGQPILTGPAIIQGKFPLLSQQEKIYKRK